MSGERAWFVARKGEGANTCSKVIKKRRKDLQNVNSKRKAGSKEKRGSKACSKVRRGWKSSSKVRGW